MAFRRSVLCTLALLAIGQSAADAQTAADPLKSARERLRSIVPAHEQVTEFIKPKAADGSVRRNYGWTHDATIAEVAANTPPARDDP